MKLDKQEYILVTVEKGEKGQVFNSQVEIYINVLIITYKESRISWPCIELSKSIELNTKFVKLGHFFYFWKWAITSLVFAKMLLDFSKLYVSRD